MRLVSRLLLLGLFLAQGGHGLLLAPDWICRKRNPRWLRATSGDFPVGAPTVEPGPREVDHPLPVPGEDGVEAAGLESASGRVRPVSRS